MFPELMSSFQLSNLIGRSEKILDSKKKEDVKAYDESVIYNVFLGGTVMNRCRMFGTVLILFIFCLTLTMAYSEDPLQGSEIMETDSGLFTYSEPSDGNVYITGFTSPEDYPEQIVFPRFSPNGNLIVGITKNAFKDKKKLRSISFQDNILSIGDSSFKDCTLLRQANLAEGLETINGGGDGSHGAFNGCIKLQSITIPSTVKSIGGHAFWGCSQLTGLTILPGEDYELSIDDNAFNSCPIAGEMVLPSKVKELGGGVFKGTKITALTIEEGRYLEAIGRSDFEACENLERITIPGNVKHINDYVFKGCTALKSANLSEGLKTINGGGDGSHGAFNGCIKLQSITIPSTVTSIGGHAFWGCSQLTGMTILPSEDYELSIDDNAFNSCPIAGEMVLPSKVKELGGGVFKGTKITALTIEEGRYLETIGRSDFEACENLERITIPGNVKHINDYAFKGCTALKSANLSEGLETINGGGDGSHGAFNGCIKLQSITIPSTVTSIGGHAFWGCSQLTGLTILPSEDYELSIDDNAFNSCPIAGGMVLPSKVKELGGGVFKGTKITALTIEEGRYLETIGRSDFEACENLEHITIPANVKHINDYAFKGCTALKNANLSEGLETINGGGDGSHGAFNGCIKLQSITIPSTVTSIGGHAFFNCLSLNSIVIYSNSEDIDVAANAFENCPGTPVYKTLPDNPDVTYKDITEAEQVHEQETWDCPVCGRTGNTNSYCGTCGHPAPWFSDSGNTSGDYLAEIVIPDIIGDRSLITSAIIYNGNEKTDEYIRKPEEMIKMPTAGEYTRVPIGILTFRGDAFRQNAASGTVKVANKMEVAWTRETGSLKGCRMTYYGIGWTGQPAIIKWSKEVREKMNIDSRKKEKSGLKEVIIGGLDGQIYFLDLNDGISTRDNITLRYPMKGTPSIHPSGYPYMSIGQYARKMANDTGDIGLRQYNLYDGREMTLIDGLDGEGEEVRPFNHVGSFETSALIDRTSDTLITAGTNGLLYTIQLGSNFNYMTGTYNQNMNQVVLRSKASGESNADTAVEASVAMFNHYVYYADMGGILRCVDTNYMKTVWAADTEDSVESTPALAINNNKGLDLFTANILNKRKKGDAQIRCFDAITGEEKWITSIEVKKDTNYKTVSGFRASPVVGQNTLDGLIYYTVNNLSETGQAALGIAGYSAALIALNCENGRIIWTYGLEDTVYSSPVAVYDENGKGWIIQCSGDGTISLLNGLNGTLVNSIKVEGHIEASPAVYNDMMVVGTTGKNDNFIYGIRIR